MLEYCYVMVKPGYANNLELVDFVKEELKSLGLEIIKGSMVLYDTESAKLHYIAKAKEDYYQELTDYITSDYSYGMILKGEDAIANARAKVQELRISLKSKFNLETDLTKNILHCTSKMKIGDKLVDIDSNREIQIFSKLVKRLI